MLLNNHNFLRQIDIFFFPAKTKEDNGISKYAIQIMQVQFIAL